MTGSVRPAVRLPGDVTSYVGRGHEMSEVRRLLGSGRLVTVTGAGGVGKTRLAMRVAEVLQGEFDDGVHVVRLAELRDADLLAGFVAGELGIRSGSKRPVDEVLVAQLRNRRMLLVLDNCEHMLQACAEFVGAVLERCREVRVLATSRQSLGVPGEQLLIVPPLPVPDGEIRSRAELEGYDGARLFVDRATAVLPSFAVTDDNYADVEWSFELCSPAEQLVWARASVFAGAFDLATAEQVCAGDRPRAARLHRDWYADVCAQAAADWSSPRQRAWVDRIRRDYADVRIAHEFCLSEPGEAVVALRMQRDLAEYMLMDRPASEASAWIDRALSLLPDDEPMRTTGLRLRAWIALFQGVGDAVWERMDVPPASFPALQAHHREQVDLARRVLGGTVFDKIFAEGRAQPGERALRYALGEEPTDVPVPAADRGGLTRRESEVAALVARGLTNQQIADALAVSRRTAETHVEHILTKLGFSTRAQIAAWQADRNPAT